MPWIAAAIGGGAVLSYFGQKQASGQQADAANNATALQGSMFNTITKQNQPYMQGGYSALNSLMYGTGTGGTNPDGTPINGAGGGVSPGQFTKGFSPTDFTNNLDPSYNFQLQQGGQAIRNADTPTQGALSGSALKDLTSFNSGMASTGYNNAFNRWNTTQNNIFGRLSGIAGMGQNAATNVGTSGTTLGTGMAQSTAAAGNATAAGTIGATNAITGSAVPLAYLMGGGNANPSAAQAGYNNSQANNALAGGAGGVNGGY